ncbi:FKBP-type peptidyl-prolyl cis-trans isomerase [Arthrobacter sp. H14-L1]|uniref:FKBP-type peptidyl-prolyl cis-trans isomerase n=1 Tax=Arthrobacter sp. H14-L1 TaxID=2996697 RepID=UPI00227170F4|nr:FKBP-type peptidyl-prolyl cis-trans isomerase [Arthrobacter sp. H14-L1]MCY0906340.1 FKBP-type peptidyl-prolyl cis-trans isomerase [Arthrobacter sp. H14-L1]
MRRLLAFFLPALLLLSACGAAGSTAGASSSPAVSVPAAHADVLSSVKVTAGAAGKAPTVDFAKPLKITDQSIRVISEGDGAKVTDGQSMVLRLAAFNAEDGTALGDSYADPAGQSYVVDSKFQQQYPLIYATFVGAKVGSDIAYGVPATAAVAGSTAAPAQPAAPAQLVIYHIEAAKDVAKPLSKPEGDTVTPPAGLPTVKDDDKGVPQITIPTTPASTTLVSQDLIKGKGQEVKATDTIVANYVGVTYKDGKTFDSSYARGKTATFALNQVIQGWTQGLTGKTVGSRVLLVIPKALGYPTPTAGQPDGDLVFVVDILGIQ